MTIDKGDCVDRAARGMFVAALALACGACGGGRHHQEPTAGNADVGGNAGVGGRASLGGSTSSAASANSGGEVAAAGDLGDGGALSEGGNSGQGGNELAGGTAGDGATHSGGASSGGMDAAGETSSAGANTGGTNTGGTNAGGTNAGGANAGGANAGGTSFGGTNAGGTNAGGTNAGGASAAGAHSGGAPGSCGDALVEAAEQCDDGNTQNLDGCNAACKYEVVDRMTSISVQSGSAPAFCAPTTNALGRAFSSAALTQINTDLQQSVSNGTLNNLLHFSGLSDLTGASNESALALGFLPAVPDLGNGPWPGGTPLEFWFRVPATSVNAQRVPLNSLLATLTARTLSAGPGLLKLPLAIGGAPSILSVSNAWLRASVNATPAPNTPAPPPTSLAPGLTVFQSLTGSGSGQGICGNVTVESLAHIPVPASLASSASSACLSCSGSRTYTACSGGTVEPGCNSMLDVLIGGCKALLCLVNVVTPAQPDVPAPGSASVRPLSLGSGNAVPSGQSTGNEDAYSSYFKFDANRAHISGLR